MASGTRTRTIAKVLSVLSLISHFFCCFLPGMISLITLLTLTGSMVLSMEDFGIPEYVHEEMIYISFAVLVLSGLINYISWKMDCRAGADACGHEPCAPKKSKYFRLYYYSVAFFVINAIIHFSFHEIH